LARPCEYSKAVADRIIRAIRDGHYRDVAARAGGISYETFRTWLKSEKPELAGFSAAIRDAEAHAEGVLYDRVLTEARTDGKHALEVLSRRKPRRYGRRDQSEVKVKGKIRHAIHPDLAGLSREQRAELFEDMAKKLREKTE
jgi:hypothetical protein